ncbi:hypothetical protein, partial [Thiolapillus sp.]
TEEEVLKEAVATVRRSNGVVFIALHWEATEDQRRIIHDEAQSANPWIEVGCVQYELIEKVPGEPCRRIELNEELRTLDELRADTLFSLREGHSWLSSGKFKIPPQWQHLEPKPLPGNE